MQIKRWKYYNVDSKGNVKGGGQVALQFAVTSSITACCTLPGCNCINSYWVALNFGLQTDGTVTGITYYFTTQQAQANFLTMN